MEACAWTLLRHLHPGAWVSSPHADAIGMGYDLGIGIALSAPGFTTIRPSLQESSLLLVVIHQGLDTGKKSVPNLALSLLAQRFKERNTIHCMIHSVHRQNQTACLEGPSPLRKN